MKKFLFKIFLTILFVSRCALYGGTQNDFMCQYHPVNWNYLQAVTENAGEKINPDIMKVNEDTEGPLRRFEITFFISLPFVFIVNFMVLHVYEVIRQGDPDVNVWTEHKILLPASTGIITTAVAAREALVNSGARPRESAGLPREQGVFLGFTKNY